MPVFSFWLNENFRFFCLVFFLVGESSIDERNRELREKEESFAAMQKMIQDKLEVISSLRSEIELLQVRFLYCFSWRFPEQIQCKKEK